MESHIPESLSTQRELPFTSPQRYLNPEPSEEPEFKPYKKPVPEKSLANASDLRISTELNSSSLQISTQQSINFKKSFFLTSPKRSIPTTPVLLANKLKEIQGQSLTMKLGEKLRDLEEDIILSRKTEGANTEKPVISERLFDLNNGEMEAELELEGGVHPEIPHLRWCAYCKAEVLTEVEYVNTEKTFWSSVGIFLAGGVFGCFLLPYMTNYCKGVKIVCHACKRPLSF